MEGICSYPTLLLMIGTLLGSSCVQLCQTTNSSNTLNTITSESSWQCPTWFIWNEASQQCECPAVNSVHVICNNTNNRTSIHWFECVTYDSEKQTTTYGWSPFANLRLAAHGEETGRYVYLPGNRSELNEFMCGGVNREGLMCSKCKPGYGPSVPTYDHKCADCSNTYSGWILYFGVTLIPTTVFFVIIVVCQVRTTAASLNLFIIACQLASVSVSLYSQHESNVIPIQPSDTYNIIRGIAVTLVTSWYLDFFRLLIPPFCVSDNLSNMQVLCMEYIIAFYPLLLTVIMYVCIQQHARGCRLLVCVWRPFGYCFAPLVKKFDWNLATSMVHTFASFLLLSSTKILFVSVSLLQQMSLTTITETGIIHDSVHVLYYDPKYVVFCQNHRPYAVLAILVSTGFVLLPCLMLILYPFSFFQKCLNRCGVTWHAVHAFADAFNGCYKDGTNGTCDCRSFAGFYLLIRILALIDISLDDQHMRVPSRVISIALLSVFSAVSPYKNRLYNILDIVGLTGSVCTLCLPQYKDILNTILVLYFSLYFGLFVSCKIICKFNCRCSHMLKALADKLAGSNASTDDIAHTPEALGGSEENLPDRLVNPEGYRLLSEENAFQSSNCDNSISTYGSIQ